LRIAISAAARVHFSVPNGLQAHAALWVEKTGDFIDTQFQARARLIPTAAARLIIGNASTGSIRLGS